MVRTFIVTALLLLFMNNHAIGEEQSKCQCDSLQIIADEILENYSAPAFNFNLERPPMTFDYVSSVELIEQYGTVSSSIQIQSFEGDPSKLEDITSRDVYIFGQSATVFLADDDTFLNLKIVNQVK